MKDYFLSKQTVFSGLGRITGYYHLLIDFIIPLYVDSYPDPVTVHVENRCLDPTFDRPTQPGVLPNSRTLYIIDNVFGDNIQFKKNKQNKECNDIWLNVSERDSYPVHDILKGQKPWWLVNFDKNPEHRGVWGDYNSSYYVKFRQNMWNKFEVEQPGQYYVTIIHRGHEANPRGFNTSNDAIEIIRDQFKTELPVRVVDFSKLSFRETISICRETRVMIGQHGAGFANSVFMEPGSSIIEYGPFKTPCYYILANKCGLIYTQACVYNNKFDILI